MQKKCFLLACFLCTGALVPPAVFGQEPTNEELLEIMEGAYEEGLWRPNVSLPSQKDDSGKESDPVANAFKKAVFFTSLDR